MSFVFRTWVLKLYNKVSFTEPCQTNILLFHVRIIKKKFKIVKYLLPIIEKKKFINRF